MYTIRIFGVIALASLSIVPMAKPFPPVLHTTLYQQNLSYQLSNISQGPLLSLPFNFTGHDPGSDSLELSVYFAGPTPPLSCQLQGGACGAIYLLNSTGGPTAQNILFASPCLVTNSFANCGTIHYSPVMTTTVYVFLDASVTGSSTVNVEGRHTWTATRIS